MPYKRKYFDAKSESKIILRNVAARSYGVGMVSAAAQ